MNLEQKIGQMLVFGWTATTHGQQTIVSSHARELVEQMQVGGVILLRRNVADDLRVTVNTINELQAISRIPLFVAADHDGGVVAEVTNNITWFASNMALGATADPRLACKSAAAMAKELTAIGVNLNFAPCLDVTSVCDDAPAGTTSFGESPEVVARFTRQAVKGYQDHGMLACARYFPGRAPVAQHSPAEPTVVAKPLAQLKKVDIKPYRAAIRAGVSCIATGGAVFPAIDPDLPAALSPRTVSGLLRDGLGFEGVIVADCLEHKQIRSRWKAREAAVMAVEAGVDLLVVAQTLHAQREVRAALIEAVKEGRIRESRVDESVARIMAVKHAYGLEDRKYADPQFLPGLLLRPKHAELKAQIAERAVTLVRNADNLIPIRPKTSDRVLIVGAIDAVGAMAYAVGAHHGNLRALRLAGLSETGLRNGVAAAAESDYIIVPTSFWGPTKDRELGVRLVKRLSAQNRKPIVVAVKEPDDLRHFPEVRTYICAYGLRGGTLPAVAAMIFGKIRPSGQLPVNISFE